MSINSAVLMGRLVRDPELRKTQSGKSVCSFTLAVDRRRKEDGADFIDCIAWEKTAEFFCKYFSKGKLAAVEGRIQTRDYTDKQGNKRKAVEIVAFDVSFCGDKSSDTSPQPDAGFAPLASTDDDLPF